jgi:hypothetical protein
MSSAQQPPPTRHELLGTMGDIIRTVDEHARELNRRWGFNRLPHIVPIEWTERFRAQKFKWERACFECTGSPAPEHLIRVRQHGEAMLRAYDKLEELALAAGKSPAPASQWEFETNDGKPIVLVRTRAEMAQVQRDPPAQVWCLEEIGEIITRFPELLAAKDAFPQAEIVQMRTDPLVIGELNDGLGDIPW